MPESVHFAPNVPQLLSLANPEGQIDGYQVHYQLTDGRTLTLMRAEAVKLNTVDPKPGEQFGICKYWDGKPKGVTTWAVWLAPATEQARAAQEMSQEPAPPIVECADASSGPIAESSGQRRRKKVCQMPPPAVPLELKPTGTDGPAPALIRQAAALPPRRVTYQEALRHVMRTVVTVLNETGEQWTSDARQDLVSTILIQAAKESRVTFDFSEVRQ